MSLTWDLPIRPWWQLELSVPAIIQEPDTGPSTAGLGDVAFETKAVVFTSSQYRFLVAPGVDVTVPTGSAAHGGGMTTVTPFVTAGIKLGNVDLLGEVGYEWIFPSDSRAGPRQEVVAGLAAAYAVRPWLVPFVELTTVSEVRGVDASMSPHLSGQTQVYLTPGFNFQIRPGRTLLFGVQLPVTNARTLDYGVRAGLAWDF
jgi:hypothetical protein